MPIEIRDQWPKKDRDRSWSKRRRGDMREERGRMRGELRRERERWERLSRFWGGGAAVLRPWKPAKELIGFRVLRKARSSTVVENPLFFSQTSIFWVHLWCFWIGFSLVHFFPFSWFNLFFGFWVLGFVIFTKSNFFSMKNYRGFRCLVFRKIVNHWRVNTKKNFWVLCLELCCINCWVFGFRENDESLKRKHQENFMGFGYGRKGRY